MLLGMARRHPGNPLMLLQDWWAQNTTFYPFSLANSLHEKLPSKTVPCWHLSIQGAPCCCDSCQRDCSCNLAQALTPPLLLFLFWSPDNSHGSIFSYTESALGFPGVQRRCAAAFVIQLSGLHNLGDLIHSCPLATPLRSKHTKQVLKSHRTHLMIMRFNKNKHGFLCICF